MARDIFRYTFAPDVPVEEAEATLLLAVLGAESLHGEAQVLLDAAHYFDPEHRACVIDAHTTVGRDLNRLFVGFVRREFGTDGFTVERAEAAATDSVGRERAPAAGAA
jgi:hypothetical protein